MSKYELVAETLTIMCNDEGGRCFYPAGCPFDQLCVNVRSEEGFNWLKSDGSHCSVAAQINDINARLQKIESKLEDKEDPESLAAFVKRKIKEAAHR